MAAGLTLSLGRAKEQVHEKPKEEHAAPPVEASTDMQRVRNRIEVSQNGPNLTCDFQGSILRTPFRFDCILGSPVFGTDFRHAPRIPTKRWIPGCVLDIDPAHDSQKQPAKELVSWFMASSLLACERLQTTHDGLSTA